jgi:protein SCO1/2
MDRHRQFGILAAALTLALNSACGVGKVPPIERYYLQGVIQSLDNQTHSATIKHHEIKGFMEAMTMEFPVKDPGEFARLTKGEAITATVFVEDTNFWIAEIKPAEMKEKP